VITAEVARAARASWHGLHVLELSKTVRYSYRFFEVRATGPLVQFTLLLRVLRSGRNCYLEAFGHPVDQSLDMLKVSSRPFLNYVLVGYLRASRE
jgi:hypothetical protein